AEPGNGFPKAAPGRAVVIKFVEITNEFGLLGQSKRVPEPLDDRFHGSSLGQSFALTLAPGDTRRARPSNLVQSERTSTGPSTTHSGRPVSDPWGPGNGFRKPVASKRLSNQSCESRP